MSGNAHVLYSYINLPEIKDNASLVFLEEGKHITFQIKRVYFIQNCNDKLDRGHHAHKKTIQALFCLKGSVDLYLSDGEMSTTVHLKSPTEGILLRPLVWHEMKHMTKETILFVAASAHFDEKDYIRNYQDFLSYIKDAHDFDE